MKALHQRLTTLDQMGREYELDYITMKNGFVYRNAKVLQHDDDSLFISTPNFKETMLATNEIASLHFTPL